MNSAALIRISSLAGLIVLGAAFVLWQSPQLLIGPLPEGQCIKPPEGTGSSLLQSSPVVFLGDSITNAGPWHLIFPDIPVKNHGVSGDTTTDVLYRLEPIIVTQPRAIFLKIGTNDLAHGPRNRQQSYRQYREILQRIQSGSPDSLLYIQSILPREAYFREEIEDFNAEIRKITKDLDIPYINLYPHFQGDDGGLADELTADGLHLNADGYMLWKKLLQPYIDRLGPAC